MIIYSDYLPVGSFWAFVKEEQFLFFVKVTKNPFFFQFKKYFFNSNQTTTHAEGCKTAFLNETTITNDGNRPRIQQNIIESQRWSVQDSHSKIIRPEQDGFES